MKYEARIAIMRKLIAQALASNAPAEVIARMTTTLHQMEADLYNHKTWGF